MSRKVNISSKQLLNILKNERKEKNQERSFIKKELNEDLCKILGSFEYKIKETGKIEERRMFLISETHDGYRYDIVYDETGDIIAYNDYSLNDGLIVAKEIELDKEKLEEKINSIEDRNSSDESDSSNNDTTKAGSGRDLASKEHEEKNDKKPKEQEKEIKPKNENEKKLKNLKNEISIDLRTKIKLDTIINGHYLWEILGIEENLKGRMPKGVSERAFRQGFLTRIDSNELSQLEASKGEKVKERKAEDTLAIVSPSGDIIELDEDVIEPEYLGTRDERLIQERNRERWADGKHASKPNTDMTLTRTSKWRIKNVAARFDVNENWFLGVDYNEDYIKYGAQTDPRQVKQISIIQEPLNSDKIYSRDSAEARTVDSIEYKLEDISEAPLNAKEQKQYNQLAEMNPNETLEVRKEHKLEIEQVIENLTKKYGEKYREEVEKKVEEKHNEGNDVEEIAQKVEKEMDETVKRNEEMEEELYRHGMVREM